MEAAIEQQRQEPGSVEIRTPPQQSVPFWHATRGDEVNGAFPSASTHNAQQDGLTSESDAPSNNNLAFPPVSSPPYWLNATTHRRRTSTLSSESSLPAGAIVLRDNETESNNDRNNACWAKSVEITDHTVVNGGATAVGAFVVWNVRVETLNGSYMNIRKRYSEFDSFRNQLVQSFPSFEAAVPNLPPKSVISKFRPNFLKKRRAGLQYFLNCIILNPEFSGSPVLKDFLFS